MMMDSCFFLLPALCFGGQGRTNTGVSDSAVGEPGIQENRQCMDGDGKRVDEGHAQLHGL